MTKQELLRYLHTVELVDEYFSYHKKDNDYLQSDYIRAGFDELGIFVDEDEIIISFNGTGGDPKEWISNLDAFPMKDGTHKSFFHDAELIFSQVKVEILNFLNKNFTVVGYSRGGALAQEFGRRLSEIVNTNVRVITFGSPRLYKWNTTNTFEHIRVSAKYDIVTKIPTWWTFPFWKHYQTKNIKIKHRLGGEFSHTHYKRLIQDFIKSGDI